MTEPSLPEESIFAQALEIASAAERAAFLDRACGDNQALRAEVEALLRAHERSGDLLDLPENLPATTDLPAREGPGTVIGPYKLLEQIGEGGMGTVWMAEQTEPIQRRVAVKVIKEGMDSRQVLARFEAERQALALMDHPNIAKVLDAGTTPSGRPYFVMELVKGLPITKYCDEQRLGVRAAAGAVRRRLPGGAARPPEGHHPPRPQAVQRAGGPVRRQAGGEGDRLRRGQGDRATPDRQDAVHRLRRVGGHAGVHVARSRRSSTTRTSTRAATSTRWACCCTSC